MGLYSKLVMHILIVNHAIHMVWRSHWFSLVLVLLRSNILPIYWLTVAEEYLV